MTKSRGNPSSIYQELQPFPGTVSDEFHKAVRLLEPIFSKNEISLWADEGLAIAKHSFRSWEAATEYFRVTPQVAQGLSFYHILHWAKWGRMLSQYSAILAGAYFRSSPETLAYLAPHQIKRWAFLGKGLYRGTWKSGSLASGFFELSPRLLRHLKFDELESFVLFVDSLAQKSYDLATECMEMADKVFPEIDKQDRKAFLSLTSLITESNWQDAKACFEDGARCLEQVEREERGRFIALATKFAQKGGINIHPFLMECSRALSELNQELQTHLLRLSEKLLAHSTTAVIEFLKSSPTVLAKLNSGQLDLWFEEGMDILRDNEEGGIAYFRLESSRGLNVLSKLSVGVELEQIKEVLRMYARALVGSDIQILSTEELKDKGIGWVSIEMATTEGTTVYLPIFIDKYERKEENFAWYKVVGTHQLAHLEFGSFGYSFDKEATFFPNLRRKMVDSPAGGDGSVTQLEKFFDLFSDRRLAYDIFTIVEDSRLDSIVKREYKGIRSIYEKIQKGALAHRPPIQSLPLREAIMELLIRISLDSLDDLYVPTEIRSQVNEVTSVARTVQVVGATVEDSAEATVRLYEILSKIPNVLRPPEEWENLDLEEELPTPQMAQRSAQATSGASGSDITLSLSGAEGQESPYSPPQQVEYRGDFKPELVQLLSKLREPQTQDDASGSSPLSQEMLQELLEKSVEIDLQDVSEGDIPATAGLFANNLLSEAKQKQTPSPEAGQGQHQIDTTAAQGGPLQGDDSVAFLYDEWDFRAGDYKPRWCCVRERTIEEGTTNFYDKTLEENAILLHQIRRQFELLAPEFLKKVKRLPDGEDFDLDALIEALVDKKMGVSPSEKFYWRKNKAQRDVSVVFLLDMSASTAEAIEESSRPSEDWDPPDDPRQYLNWLKARREEGTRRSYKRIIDVEKESAVLLIRALETIGDAYGIYGFSGYGRENVEFYVIKDIFEEFSDKVKRRIDRINPLHATRMGPAIRHATYKLEKQDSRTKVLFLISDGRPQDRGYSREGVEKEYAVHDTKMALTESKRKGIIPFCLTVDKGRHDYMKTMCQDMGYEVLSNIKALPKRLPILYRQLTV
ncbi:MAG: VWA domain-containing protein [Dehalococcoidia bacterium]